MYVNEIFSSIQGEGMYMGRPAIFVRFAGCNVHCEFCDTAYAQTCITAVDIHPGELKERIVKELGDCLATLVVFTGGEPLLQCHEMNVTIQQLLRDIPYLTIQVETSGSVEPYEETGAQELFSLGVDISLSPKKLDFMHPEWLAVASQLKVLVDFDGPIVPDNFQDLGMMLRIHRAHGKRGNNRIYFQPVALGGPKRLSIPADCIHKAIELARQYNGYLGVQLHKYLDIR